MSESSVKALNVGQDDIEDEEAGEEESDEEEEEEEEEEDEEEEYEDEEEEYQRPEDVDEEYAVLFIYYFHANPCRCSQRKAWNMLTCILEN